jgi:hypothetical protein
MPVFRHLYGPYVCIILGSASCSGKPLVRLVNSFIVVRRLLRTAVRGPFYSLSALFQAGRLSLPFLLSLEFLLHG